jgi:hypothetical protein
MPRKTGQSSVVLCFIRGFLRCRQSRRFGVRCARRFDLQWANVANIQIHTVGGLKTRRATVFGNLAVHPSLEGRSGDFTITHVPTGYAVKTCQPEEFCLFMTKGLGDLPLWRFTRPSTIKKRIAAFRAAWLVCEIKWFTLQSANAAKHNPPKPPQKSAANKKRKSRPKSQR